MQNKTIQDFYGAERRQPFEALSRYFPSIMGSVMVVKVRK
ncbi:hypothetical protein FDUTEX481_00915 [Tolypothrix sp. PCC 7601]|nr:hypothetical protein FDUTEX481_00915 [Tolypothrix sp. PCC 7601]BAY92047.1 hypothetical protein NIES3275_40780 [Microchaete diplosiphon NIES-3275]